VRSPKGSNALACKPVPVPIRIGPTTGLLLHSVGEGRVVCAAVHRSAPDLLRSLGVLRYHTVEGVPGRSPQGNEESSSDSYVTESFPCARGSGSPQSLGGEPRDLEGATHILGAKDVKEAQTLRRRAFFFTTTTTMRSFRPNCAKANSTKCLCDVIQRRKCHGKGGVGRLNSNNLKFSPSDFALIRPTITKIWCKFSTSGVHFGFISEWKHGEFKSQSN
jgi:hypothetical protein